MPPRWRKTAKSGDVELEFERNTFGIGDGNPEERLVYVDRDGRFVSPKQPEDGFLIHLEFDPVIPDAKSLDLKGTVEVLGGDLIHVPLGKASEIAEGPVKAPKLVDAGVAAKVVKRGEEFALEMDKESSNVVLKLEVLKESGKPLNLGSSRGQSGDSVDVSVWGKPEELDEGIVNVLLIDNAELVEIPFDLVGEEISK
ncbi:MAG: hypothetical protein AAF585_22095 [Verrucomicrobiota bacterium]